MCSLWIVGWSWFVGLLVAVQCSLFVVVCGRLCVFVCCGVCVVRRALCAVRCVLCVVRCSAFDGLCVVLSWLLFVVYCA